MEKKFGLILTLLLAVLSLNGQIFDPVVWQFSYEQRETGVYEVVISATISEGSHIYGMDVPEGGPIPTSIIFNESSDYSIEGEIVEVIPPVEKFDEAFGFNIKSYSKKVEFRQLIKARSGKFTLTGMVEYMACNNISCSPPKEVEFSLVFGGKSDSAEITEGAKTAPIENDKGLIGFFIGAFLLGLVGAITPCVYPMIPLTVAFFSKSSDNRRKSLANVIVFSFSIVLIYALPGLIISIFGVGAGFANDLSTHWLPNLLFFLLFVLFAASFLGAFEITLPSGWSTKTDSKVDKGGVLASFFMALTTVIVSFSCTGPIVGGLLVEAVRGDVLRPVLGMVAFGLAFSVPFTLFALSPTLLGKIPRSGSWLSTVKFVLGLLMVAFSLKFLMVIDSVYSLHILSRPVYLVIFISIFIVMGLYLIGFFEKKGSKKVSITRSLFAVIPLFIACYFGSGLFGSPLKAVSSLLPPPKTVSFKNQEQTGKLTGQGLVFKDGALSLNSPKYGDLFSMPYGLTGFFEYSEGMAYAKLHNKPVLIDFKGHACANCKKMEAKVWSDPSVLKRLKEDFVIISLYVDDRTILPEEEWIVSKVDGKLKKSIGKINEELEITMYNTNTLPLYVIADHQGVPVVAPSVANFDTDSFIEWLDQGIIKFHGR